mmetsp:Transcript_62079/g.192306  ORF Transcript_62079/g.192306 Transcript_62079/m.192306 type:complete len:245 (+) Transcript_62079:279-1013(+)
MCHGPEAPPGAAGSGAAGDSPVLRRLRCRGGCARDARGGPRGARRSTVRRGREDRGAPRPGRGLCRWQQRARGERLRRRGARGAQSARRGGDSARRRCAGRSARGLRGRRPGSEGRRGLQRSRRPERVRNLVRPQLRELAHDGHERSLREALQSAEDGVVEARGRGELDLVGIGPVRAQRVLVQVYGIGHRDGPASHPGTGGLPHAHVDTLDVCLRGWPRGSGASSPPCRNRRRHPRARELRCG